LRHAHRSDDGAKVNNTIVSGLQVRQDGGGERRTGSTLHMLLQCVPKPMCRTHSANGHGT